MSDDVDHAEVAAANRRFYARTATIYEATETCIVDQRRQRLLELQLDDVVGLVGDPAVRPMIALDACGGSGNVAMKLLNRGLRVVNVDVSPEVHSIFRSKLAATGYYAEAVESEIADFLRRDDREFDLVVFSSALHHIKDLETVMRLVAARLRPGGVLFTTFDPTLRSRLRRATRLVLWADSTEFALLARKTVLGVA